MRLVQKALNGDVRSIREADNWRRLALERQNEQARQLPVTAKDLTDDQIAYHLLSGQAQRAANGDPSVFDRSEEEKQRMIKLLVPNHGRKRF